MLCYRQEDEDEIWHRIHRMGGLLDSVHIDVWGPTKTASLRGHQYFISFVDDLSNDVLENNYRTFSNKARFNSLTTLICFRTVKGIQIPLF